MEEISRRQISKALLQKKDDKNIFFFHRMANARRRINYNGIELAKVSLKIHPSSKKLQSFFEDLYSREDFFEALLGGHSILFHLFRFEHLS